MENQVNYNLGSVTDECVSRIFNEQKIDVVYHTAYKHVPILENNIISGIKTMYLARNTLQILRIVSGPISLFCCRRIKR